MDRHEFHRMAHQDDRHSHQTIPFPSEERREVRIISPHNSMYPFPRGSFLFEPTHPDTVSYPTVQLRRMAPSLGVCARLSDVCHPSNKRTFSNDLGDSMRHEVTRWVGTIGLKRAESYSQDVYPNRQMHSTTSSIPMGYYAVQQSQRTTSCLGMIARTLVRRPLQFRGSVNDIKMNRSSMTTYSESERPSFSEQTRTHHGRESTQHGCHLETKDIVESSKWNGNVPGVCFTSNGMMQMDMTRECTQEPQTVQRVDDVPEDDANGMDLDSLRIAQQIGNNGSWLSAPAFSSKTPSNKTNNESYEVLNLISDDEDGTESQIEDVGRTSNGSLRIRSGIPFGGNRKDSTRVLKCLQPLLDAIDIVSNQESESNESQSEKESVSTGSKPETIKRTTGKYCRKGLRLRSNTRSLNAMALELSQKQTQSGRTRRSRESETGSVESGLLQKRPRSQSDEAEENPYRKIYRQRKRNQTFSKEEIHDLEDIDDAALWNFLNSGLPSSVIFEKSRHPQPPNASSNDPFSQFPSELLSNKDFKAFQAWLQQLTDPQRQLLVEHYGLCGLARYLPPSGDLANS